MVLHAGEHILWRGFGLCQLLSSQITLKTGLLPTGSMDKGDLSSRGRKFSGMGIYDGHLVPEAKE